MKSDACIHSKSRHWNGLHTQFWEFVVTCNVVGNSGHGVVRG